MSMYSNICRTCLKTKPKEKCTKISPNEENEETSYLLEMISYSIPELDMFVVVDPVICENCIATLEVSFKFKMECLKNQERLLKFSNRNSSKVDLLSIYNRIRKPDDHIIEHNNNESITKKPQTVPKRNSPEKNRAYPSLSCPKCQGCDLKISDDPSSHSKMNIGPFICYSCNREFEDISKLRKHTLGHVRQRRCKICSKTFRDLDTLKRHLRVHTRINPFKCNICLKEFRQKHNLTQHILQHVQSKKLTCVHCQKVFSTKYNLKVHMKNAHRQKEFCDLCGESFSTKSELVEHLHTTTEKCGNEIRIKKEIKQENHYTDQGMDEGDIKDDPETLNDLNMDQSISDDHHVETEAHTDMAKEDIDLLLSASFMAEESSQSDADIDILN